MKFNEYVEAGKVQTVLEKLIQKFPIKDHPAKWLCLCRTVRTYIQLVERECKKCLNLQ